MAGVDVLIVDHGHGEDDYMWTHRRPSKSREPFADSSTAVALNALEGEDILVYVQDFGHDGTHAEVLSQDVIIVSDTKVVETVRFEGGDMNTLSSWIKRDSMHSDAFGGIYVLLAALVAVVFCLLGYRRMKRPPVLHTAQSPTTVEEDLQNISNIMTSEQLWRAPDELQMTFRRMVETFQSRKHGREASREQNEEWLSNAKRIATAFEETLQQLRLYLINSRSNRDVEDEMFLFDTGCMIKSKFELFEHFRTSLAERCETLTDRLRKYLLRATETDCCSEIYLAMELLMLSGDDPQFAEMMGVIQIRLHFLIDVRRNALDEESIRNRERDLRELDMALGVTDPGDSVPTMRRLDLAVAAPATDGLALNDQNHALGLMFGEIERSRIVREQQREVIAYAIERSRIMRDSLAERRRQEDALEASLRDERTNARLHARLTFDSWRRDVDQAALCRSLAQLHLAMDTTFSDAARDPVERRFSAELSARRLRDRWRLTIFMLVFALLYIYGASNGTALTNPEVWFIKQMSCFCSHLLLDNGLAPVILNQSCSSAVGGSESEAYIAFHDISITSTGLSLPSSGVAVGWGSYAWSIATAPFSSSSAVLVDVLYKALNITKLFGGPMLDTIQCTILILLKTGLWLCLYLVVLKLADFFKIPHVEYCLTRLFWPFVVWSLRQNLVLYLWEHWILVAVYMTGELTLFVLHNYDHSVKWRMRPAVIAISSRGAQSDYNDIRPWAWVAYAALLLIVVFSVSPNAWAPLLGRVTSADSWRERISF